MASSFRHDSLRLLGSPLSEMSTRLKDGSIYQVSNIIFFFFFKKERESILCIRGRPRQLYNAANSFASFHKNPSSPVAQNRRHGVCHVSPSDGEGSYRASRLVYRCIHELRRAKTCRSNDVTSCALPHLFFALRETLRTHRIRRASYAF